MNALTQFIGYTLIVFAMLIIAAVLDALRNGVDPRRALELIPPEKNPEVFGDVPCMPTQARYPNESALIGKMRKVEP